MARQINRLTTRLVAALVERAGRGQLRPEDYRRHADGGNLYLVVKENGGIGWSFIYRLHGKPIEIGLGSAHDVSLGSARRKAALRSSALGVEDALCVLKPVWMARPATARKIRERCERLWDSARARGQCTGMNPFVWRGLLSALLPKPQKLTRARACVPGFLFLGVMQFLGPPGASCSAPAAQFAR